MSFIYSVLDFFSFSLCFLPEVGRGLKWDLTSQTRDGTWASVVKSVGSEPVDQPPTPGTPFWTYSSWKINSFYLSIQLARKNSRNERHCCLVIIVSSLFGARTINTHHKVGRKVCPHQNPRDGAPAGERRNLMR